MALQVRAPLAFALLLFPFAGAISSEMQEVLDKHNVYRCMHDLPLFTWDDAIAANAQAYADVGVYEHSSDDARMINGEQCGENLAWGYPTRTGTDSTIAWYSEIEFTEPYGTADSMSDSVPANEAIGHYTQMIWKSSTKLGCGKGRATYRRKSGDFWVCQYGPAGNWGGRFTSEVLAPTKIVQECGGSSSDVPGGGSGVPGVAAPSTSFSPSSGGCIAPADQSRGECETCFHGDQCPDGYYCCPYMKKCVNSGSMSCYYPIADCSPMCYDSSCSKDTGCDCSQCANAGAGKEFDWLTWANLVNSNAGGTPEELECPGAAFLSGSMSLNGCLSTFMVLLAALLQ